jgi:serine/threonine-protein kinase
VELTPGTVLQGKYRVDEVLGVGGMGEVLRATHVYLQQSVAIKILLPAMADAPSTIARFLREAQATARLKGEHIARVIDLGSLPDSRPFIVLEYLEGNDLNQILCERGPQPSPLVCDFMLQACEGLAEAHALGFVHRDIKPSNFFITRRPDGSMLLKILDFGISKPPAEYDDLTGTQMVIGTPTYMAPEQMKGGRQVDARSDIWSLGVVVYQLLQGRPPFAGESYAELVLAVGTEAPQPLHVPLPPGLSDVIYRCLEKDPSKRQQDVGELARMLAPFASDPMAGAQIAARTNRVLQSQGRKAPGGVGGSPAAVSPVDLPGWPPAPSTSLSQGNGQITHRTGAKRGWLVSTVLSVAILAGAGGYIVNDVMRRDDRRQDRPAGRAAAAMADEPAPQPVPVQREPGPGSGSAELTATSGHDGPGSAAVTSGAWKPTTPQPTLSGTPPTSGPRTATVPTPTKVADGQDRSSSKPTARASVTRAKPTTPSKPKPKPTTTRRKGDLFDSRH